MKLSSLKGKFNESLCYMDICLLLVLIKDVQTRIFINVVVCCIVNIIINTGRKFCIQIRAVYWKLQIFATDCISIGNYLG